MLLKTIKKLMIICTLVWLTGCAQTSVRQHQDFELLAKDIQSVVILPADAVVELINFDGENELLEEKADLIRSQIEFIAKDKLVSEHLNVIDFDFTNAIAANEDFAYAITKTKEAWKKSSEEMYRQGLVSEKEKARFTTNLGSVLNTIAELTEADAALLLNYSAYEKSDGMIAKDVASSVLVGVLTLGAVVPIQATQGSFFEAALVDMNTGKVIWANRKAGAADSSPANYAFDELPDLVWKSELPQATTTTDSTLAPKEQTLVPNVQASMAVNEK